MQKCKWNYFKSYDINHTSCHSVWEFRVILTSTCFTLTFCMAYSSTLKMEAVISSKMSAQFYRLHHIIVHEKGPLNLEFEVLTAVVFSDITPCNPLTINRRFGGTSSWLKNKWRKKDAWSRQQVAYHFQTGNNKIKLLTEYKILTQKVDSVSSKTFWVILSHSSSSFILFHRFEYHTSRKLRQ
jgi:hypothetical protein